MKLRATLWYPESQASSTKTTMTQYLESRKRKKMTVIVEWIKPYRNKKLLEIVRQSPCQHCGIQDGTVCAAHSNFSEHGKGMGQKASDSCIAALCYRCHSLLDHGKDLSKAERREMWLNAYVNTMRWLIENEKLILA